MVGVLAQISTGLRRLSEAVAAMFMALIFLTFILQIAVRYGARVDGLTAALPILEPRRYGWTLELCLALWVWLIFWGNAFVVRRSDHVTFDLLYLAVPRGVRRAFLAICGLAVGVGLLLSIEPTWSRFAILRLKQTATLGELLGPSIRMRDIYSIYMVFLVAVGLRALWAALEALIGRHADPADESADAR
jgi:C4-dicarboxylate transporter, DctQ subunit